MKWPHPHPGMAILLTAWWEHNTVFESHVELQAALILDHLRFLIMSVMAAVDQHVVCSHLVASFPQVFQPKCTRQKGITWNLFCWMWCDYTRDSNASWLKPSSSCRSCSSPLGSCPLLQACRDSCSLIFPITLSSPDFTV